jgi:uncharacterized protein (DUF1501 family)
VGTAPTTDRSLVVIELGGGNDTLSTIVPLSSRYRDLRPTTAIDNPIPIDREIGLHPALTTVVGISDASGLASNFPWWVDDPRDFAGVWSGFAPANVPIEQLDPIRRAISTTASAQTKLQRSLKPLQDTLGSFEVDSQTLEGQLALAGALIASDVDPRVIYVHGNTDFDTHEDQITQHGELMGQLDRGLAHFFKYLVIRSEY